MAWLNLNDSFNTLKGQISTFANNVLADEEEQEGELILNTEVDDLQRICQQQQEEINQLRSLNAQLADGRKPSKVSKDGFDKSDESWSWEVSDAANQEKDKTIADLKQTISQLQREKDELTSNLVLLDSEHQLNNEKLINMKNKLQKEYNELEQNCTKLQEENEVLTKEKKKSKEELENMKLKHQENLDRPADINSNESCTKCETFLQENAKFRLEVEKLANELSDLKNKNDSLEKSLNDLRIAKAEEIAKIGETLKLNESENKILVSELKKATQSISEFEQTNISDSDENKKLALELADYKEQVNALKHAVANNSTSSEEYEKLKFNLEHAIMEKEQTHTKYINILTENMKRYIDCDNLSEVKNSESETDGRVLEFNHQVENILNILWDLKSKCTSLEKELYNVTQEKTTMLSEKNHEIEKLIQNSEILSQEVITKSQTIKDYENECNELIKNNDLLIGELKMLKSNVGLQTISESNEDNILLLESQLENANRKIEELESLRHENISSNELPVDEYMSKTVYNKLLKEFDEAKKENIHLKNKIQRCNESCLVISDEKEKIKTDLENTEYQYTELNVNLEVLKEEVETQKKKFEHLLEEKLSIEKLNMEYERSNEDIRSELNVVREKLLLEEDARKQCDAQIRSLIEKLQNSKMRETSLKLQYDTISKELSALAETKCSLEANLKDSLSFLDKSREELDELKQENEKLKTQFKNKETVEFESVNLSETSELEALRQEKIDLLSRFEELQQLYASLLGEKASLTLDIEKSASITDEHLKCSKNIDILEKKVEELEAAKNELTNVIITKHQESVTYHNEIKRLTQVLNTEAEKNRTLTSELETMKILVSDAQKKDEEIEKLTDQNSFLRQKCEVLAQNLLDEQANVQKILAEQSGVTEKEQNLARKLERLQTHLIEVEEHYTQELLRAEEKNAVLQTKVNEVEQREKDSSTMYTSVSIRANQHVETLQTQLQLITNQRDELRKKISDAEDHAGKQEAALANLQFVLEQFQKEKENDVRKETERIRRQITIEKKIQEDLRTDISALQSQLEESKHGLLAASRLSDQLEHSKQLVTTLKAEVSQLKEQLQKNEEQLQNLSSQSDGKVDKSLVKSLVIGFISSNNNLNKDQTQILKIIATVLDFNQQDHDKVNLNKPHQGWLGSFLNPHTSQGMSQESLSQAFVKFLENESKPRVVPSLLNNENETPKSRKNSTRQSPSLLSEMVLPTFADFAQNRNSSSILKDVLKDNS